MHGVIFIAGVGVALGHTDKERTAAQFITHPRTAKYLFRTGDLGRLRPSGFLEVLGREDDQVKGNVFQSNWVKLNAHCNLMGQCRALVYRIQSTWTPADRAICHTS